MSKLAVFFPGLGYHCDKPLLYYARKLAAALGYEECITICFQYDGKKIFQDKSKIPNAIEDLYGQATEQLAMIDWKSYEDVVFFSKSIGTAVATRYVVQNGILCKNIYFTPLEQTFVKGMSAGRVFSGTNDSWIDIDRIKEECERYKIPLSIYKDANHSLETEDVFVNLQILTDVMNRTLLYLQE